MRMDVKCTGHGKLFVALPFQPEIKVKATRPQEKETEAHKKESNRKQVAKRPLRADVIT